MLTTVFTYGTLMPGHLRWGLIAPFASSHRPAHVDGQLFDTGRGWPAACFAAPLGAEPVAGDHVAPGATIPGWLVQVDPGAFATLIGRLDEVEGAVGPDGDGCHPAGRTPAPPGNYRRVRVGADDGTEAWAYEACVVEPSWVPVPEWSGQAEN